MQQEFYCLLFFISFVTAGYAQVHISGKVLQPSGEPVAYVNIGIKNKNTGTVSGETGLFSIQLKPENQGDTLTFSCTGFEELNIPVRQVVAEQRDLFYLKPRITELKEVVIGARQLKRKTVGTKSVNPLLWGNATSKDGKDIIEMCKRINIKTTTYLESLHVYLKGVSTRQVIFRVHFYEVKEDQPGERLVDKMILCKKDIDNGWLEIDLTDQDLVMEEDFFVSIEFLPVQPARGYSFSYGGQMGGSLYARHSSLGRWEKNSGATIAMYLTVKQ